MHINTKVVFEWDDKTKEYRETSSEGYEYDGEMMLMQYTGQGPPDPSQRGWFGNMFGQGGSLWGGIGDQMGMKSDDPQNVLNPLMTLFGQGMMQKQAEPQYMTGDKLRTGLMENMDSTVGGYEDMRKMMYGGGPIMDAARQQMRGGLADVGAQYGQQQNQALAQRGMGGMSDILSQKMSSQMGEQMRKGETDLTRYGMEAGRKGLEGLTDIYGGVNTAVMNQQAQNMAAQNKYRAQKAAGSGAMWSGLGRGLLGGISSYMNRGAS